MTEHRRGANFRHGTVFRLYYLRFPWDSWTPLCPNSCYAIRLTCTSTSAGIFLFVCPYPKSTGPSKGLYAARRNLRLNTKTAIPIIIPINKIPICVSDFPSNTTNAPSKECHEEEPRWWNKGVTTSPFRLCKLGFSFRPARTLRSVLFIWRVWTAL